MTPVLQTRGIKAWYGDFQALFGIDLSLGEGEAVALVGANGAGKSTFLRAVSRSHEGQWDGTLSLNGESLVRYNCAEVARRGIILVPEGRQLFPSLTVRENLEIGASTRRDGPWTLDRILHLFPDLSRMLDRPAMLLSGGQQQMVAIGRALMSNPQVLLCDEVSLGLAPVIIEQMYSALADIRRSGTSMIIVEQSIHQALQVSDRILCLRTGAVTYEGESKSADLSRIETAYFGMETA
jgi:branched-chain amino acid transport system ATP-binding protein